MIGKIKNFRNERKRKMKTRIKLAGQGGQGRVQELSKFKNYYWESNLTKNLLRKHGKPLVANYLTGTVCPEVNRLDGG